MGGNERTMSMTDSIYYTHRARDERERATKATDPAVANVHTELAERYEALLDAAAENSSAAD